MFTVKVDEGLQLSEKATVVVGMVQRDKQETKISSKRTLNS
jgi:hypothetical protein